ncbi:MAG: UDP-3-O-(3-hydroxymyristoyl)glucosamine N-acyltransferase [Elusimicrobia bacterium RIFCSPLOWO2_01_FULL_59_12]|nr:MAG: UDP-3-O-(3-hydroxymyristoyl)glucosamine N-acyltransferase [Elusimicrobia bacterium RIFCSPLOWO2_01_FULL_59_12]
MTSAAATGIPASEIAQAVRGLIEGDGTIRIEGAAGLEEATERHISFFHNPKYSIHLEKTKAGAILLSNNTNGLLLPSGKTLIRVPNPPMAFAQVLALFERRQLHHPAPGIHPQAVVSPQANIGPGAAIGPLTVVEEGAHIGAGSVLYSGCYIGARVRIGENCLVYPNVVLREDTQLGARVVVQPGAVLGSDGYGFATQGGTHHKIPQIGKVVVEDDVEIGANVTIDRATTGETRIGAGTKIDNLVHIAHNVHIGKNCLIVAQVGISGSTRIGDQVTLAGQAGIVGHITIGDGAVIGAQAGVIGDVEPGAVLWGTPARPHRETMKLQAIFGKLPEIYDALKALKKKFL